MHVLTAAMLGIDTWERGAMAESRGPSWWDKEVIALIAIWEDARVQQELDGAVRNKAVFEKISRKMTGMDYMQCRLEAV